MLQYSRKSQTINILTITKIAIFKTSLPPPKSPKVTDPHIPIAIPLMCPQIHPSRYHVYHPLFPYVLLWFGLKSTPPDTIFSTFKVTDPHTPICTPYDLASNPPLQIPCLPPPKLPIPIFPYVFLWFGVKSTPRDTMFTTLKVTDPPIQIGIPTICPQIQLHLGSTLA